MFEACCASNHKLSKDGFATYDEAEAYVFEHLCPICKELVTPYNPPLFTGCGSEWFIWKIEKREINRSL